MSESDKLEILAEGDKAFAEFQESRERLAGALTTMRTTLVRYADEVDRTAAARTRYSRARQRAIRELRGSYRTALQMIRLPQVGSPDADSEASNVKQLEATIRHVITVIRNYEAHSIYDLEVLEGAERMLIGGQNLAYLALAAARSAFCCGVTESGKKWLQLVKPEDWTDLDRSLMASAERIQSQWDREQEARRRDAEADDLPRVKFTTSSGDFVIELFLTDAPSSVSHFIGLCEEGAFDGVDFYQVVDDLLALAGDPDESVADVNFLRDEHSLPTARPGVRGSVLLAKRPIPKSPNFVPHSGGRQFAILMVPIAVAAEQQTVIGRVVEGMDVVCNFRRVDPTREKKKGEIVVPATYIIGSEVIRRPDELPEPVYFDHAAASHAGHAH